MPLSWSSVVCRMIQSTTRLKKRCGHGTPLSDTKMDFNQHVTITNTAGKVVIEAFYDLIKVGGDSIRSKYSPETAPVHAAQGLGKICNVHIESSLPFVTLFNYISRRENLMDKTSSCPETCLFLVKFKVMMTFAKILLGLDNRKKTEKKEREKNQQTSTKTVSKKRQNKWTNEIISQKQKIICLKKKIKNDNNKGKNRKDNKSPMQISRGGVTRPPKPVRKLFLVCQLQITLGEMLFGPQARFRITPIVWFKPATWMTSPALVVRLRLPIDHSAKKTRATRLLADHHPVFKF